MAMIRNLFSSFDPSSFSWSLNWSSSIIFIILIGSQFYLKKHKIKIITQSVINMFLKEVNMIIPDNKIFRILITSLFLFIIFNNFLGLFPYIFTSTRHITITLSISLTIWLGLIFFGWTWKNKNRFAHLVPIRTPNMLIPFIVLIETIRRLIRPITLAIRLSANIIAGHLLITLIGNQLANLNIIYAILPTQFMLVGLEIAVSLIQAYVFSILLTLYIREVREH